MPPLVHIKAVTKRYRSVVAVDEVSFTVDRGHVVSVLGPNGAGKTSLVRMILGITRPDEGTIVVGTDAAPLPRHRIGYLPEERGLYKGMPVDKTLAFFAGLAGLDRKTARMRARDWLDRLGLADRAGDKLEELSRGNQQRVQFISAILHKPDFLVLDEPFSGLDPLGQDLFIQLIKEISAAGTTILMSAHQMKLVERCADHLHLLSDGRLVRSGTLAELRAQSGLGERYIIELAQPPPNGARLETISGISAIEETVLDNVYRLTVTLAPDAAVGPLLAALDPESIIRAEREALGLHEIYVHTALSVAEGQRNESAS